MPLNYEDEEWTRYSSSSSGVLSLRRCQSVSWWGKENKKTVENANLNLKPPGRLSE
jgi:hypothetical protein